MPGAPWELVLLPQGRASGPCWALCVVEITFHNNLISLMLQLPHTALPAVKLVCSAGSAAVSGKIACLFPAIWHFDVPFVVGYWILCSLVNGFVSEQAQLNATVPAQCWLASTTHLDAALGPRCIT